MVLTNIRTLLTRKYFFIQLVLSEIPKYSKNTIWPLIHFYFYFYYIFILGNLIWNTANSLSHPSIMVIHQSNLLVSKHKVLLGSKHLSIYPCSTTPKAYWLRWVMVGVLRNILINLFYFNLICITLYHATY